VSLSTEPGTDASVPNDDDEKPSPAKKPKAAPAIASFFQPRKAGASKPAAAKLKGKASVASFFQRKPAPAAEPAPEEEDTATGLDMDGVKSIRKGGFNPVDAAWRMGEPVPYSALCEVLRSVEGVSARLEMQRVSPSPPAAARGPPPPAPSSPRPLRSAPAQILSDFLRSIIALTPEDLLCTVYLCSNRLAPAYENLELGIGDSILVKAVCAATGRTLSDVKAAARKSGDLGLVAEASRGKQSTLMRPKPLTVRGVFREAPPPPAARPPPRGIPLTDPFRSPPHSPPQAPSRTSR